MAVEAGGLYLDYSKNRITDQTLALLGRLADECGLAERREAMFRGEPPRTSGLTASASAGARGCFLLVALREGQSLWGA